MVRQKTLHGRSVVFDVARALSALYIVGFWHGITYVPTLGANVKTSITRPWQFGCTRGCLAFFFFASAWLVAKKATIRSFADARRFWNRRFFRLWPLYALALVAMREPLWRFPLSLVGLNNFVPGIAGHNILTLWFVSQMLVYYAMFPALAALRGNSKTGLARFTVACAAIEVCFWLGASHFRWDPRMWQYFPVYAVGIAVSNWDEKRVVGVSFALAAGFFALGAAGNLNAAPVATVFCGCGLVVALSASLSRLPSVAAAAAPVAYASMCAYLFHRKTFIVLSRLLFRAGGPEAGTLRLVAIHLCAVTVVFTSGWLIQRAYDRALGRLFSKQKTPRETT